MSGDAKQPNDRCDKCGTHISEWSTKPCVRSITQSPRHTITRFHLKEAETPHWMVRDAG